MNAYALWKLVHILGSAVLFGTGMGIAFFAWAGYRRAIAIGQIDGLRAVLRLTVIADAAFTAPAVISQLVSGLVLLRMNSWPIDSAWAMTSLLLYFVVGLLWLPVVFVQILMSREANCVASIELLSPAFHRRFIFWFVLGVPAFLIVIAVFYLMVAKPLPLV